LEFRRVARAPRGPAETRQQTIKHDPTNASPPATLEASTMTSPRRLPRLTAAVVLACSMSFPLLCNTGNAFGQEAAPADATATPAPADATAAPADATAAPADATAAPADAAAATEPAATQPAVEDVTPANAPLADVAEAFLHYGTLARYDVAALQANKILNSGKSPEEVLNSFEAVMARRMKDRRGGPTLENMLDTWSMIDQTKEPVTKLRKVLTEARLSRMSKPAFIDQAIQDLLVNERAYTRAVALLKQSGELAVPQMVDYLRDPSKTEYHARIQRALVDMGRQTLNPLAAALDLKDADAVVMIVNVLADLGYDSAIPYLVDLNTRQDSPAAVKQAAQVALRNISAGRGGAQPSGAAGDLYYDLAEKFYYGTTTIVSDKHYPNAFVWYVTPNRGLARKEVPHVIFNDVMAMRISRRAMERGTTADAQSLWLASNYKREAQLPQGASDPTAPQDSAHFYGVDSGTQHLNAVLARSVKDRDSAVSLRAIKSLQEIVGRANLFAGDAGQPLIDGMRSSDRLVRFESAFAVAAALPQQQFPGQERVVPLLAEALSQTGTSNVLVVASTDDNKNRVSGELKGFGVAGATGLEAAMNEATTLPTVDAVVITKDVSDDDVVRLLELTAAAPRVDRAVQIVVRGQKNPPIERNYVRRRDVVFTDVETGDGLKKIIDAARARLSGAALESATATDYALRATRLLGQIAKARGATVLETQPAHQVLLHAMSDPRPEVAKEVAGVLAWIDAPQVQPGLASVALDEKTPPEVKVALFKGLAGNAKNFGNHLEQAQFAALQTAVQNGESPELRVAAAEAAGASNLPGEQAKRLILDWKVENAAAQSQPAAPAPAAPAADAGTPAPNP
jgi:HEAT repeat protein